jgi:hypothetical protein
MFLWEYFQEYGTLLEVMMAITRDSDAASRMAAIELFILELIGCGVLYIVLCIVEEVVVTIAKKILCMVLYIRRYIKRRSKRNYRRHR